jgi:hypothetical protein
MVTTIVIASIFGVALCAIAAWRFESKRLQKKRSRFSDREKLSLDELYSKYFEPTGLQKDVVVTYWQRVADTMGLEAGRLRPTDRFDSELRPVAGHLVEDEIADLNQFFELEVKRRKLVVPGKPKTLGDLMNVLAAGK